MSERPIIFSAEMVRAILAGRKTQTRRVCKFTDKGLLRKGKRRWHPDDPEALKACPYGAPGDTLWVREACWAESTFDGDGVRYAADHAWRIIENTQEASDAWCKLAQYGGDDALDNQTNIGRRVPSIHMPRWASRITLRITDVRVERLQDISCADAEAEGAGHEAGLTGGQAREAFALLWNRINGAGAWEANPWVWAILFERVKP